MSKENVDTVVNPSASDMLSISDELVEISVGEGIPTDEEEIEVDLDEDSAPSPYTNSDTIPEFDVRDKMVASGRMTREEAFSSALDDDDFEDEVVPQLRPPIPDDFSETAPVRPPQDEYDDVVHTVPERRKRIAPQSDDTFNDDEDDDDDSEVASIPQHRNSTPKREVSMTEQRNLPRNEQEESDVLKNFMRLAVDFPAEMQNVVKSIENVTRNQELILKQQEELAKALSLVMDSVHERLESAVAPVSTALMTLQHLVCSIDSKVGSIYDLADSVDERCDHIEELSEEAAFTLQSLVVCPETSCETARDEVSKFAAEPIRSEPEYFRKVEETRSAEVSVGYCVTKDEKLPSGDKSEEPKAEETKLKEEAPKAQPKTEETKPKAEAPKPQKAEAPKAEVTKTKTEAPKSKTEAPKAEVAKTKTEAPKPQKAEAPKAQPKALGGQGHVNLVDGYRTKNNRDAIGYMLIGNPKTGYKFSVEKNGNYTKKRKMGFSVSDIKVVSAIPSGEWYVISDKNRTNYVLVSADKVEKA